MKTAIYLNEEQVRELLGMEEAIKVIEEAFRQHGTGKAVNRPRYRLKTAKGILHLMPSAVPNMGVMGYKVYVTAKGTSAAPILRLMLHSFETGELLAVMEAFNLSQIRTGAASAVATKYMARKNSTSMGIIGAGLQGEAQARGICAVADIKLIRVYDIDSERCDRFCNQVAASLGVEVIGTESAQEAARGMDIVATSTTSSEPVLFGEWLKEGVHVNAMGSNALIRREIDDAVVSRSNIIVVDDREEAKLECGDLLRAVETGLLQWEQLPELGEVVTGKVQGRASEKDITLFESHGLALEDVAAAVHVYQLALAKGVGQKLPF